MKKLFITLMLSIPASLFAGVGFGTSIHSATIDSGYGNVDFSPMTLNGIYESRNDNLAWQFKLGLGLTDDSDKDNDGDSYDFEVNNTIQLKGMYFMNDNVYAALTYTKIDAEVYVEWADEKVDVSENDLGFMLGYRQDNFDIFFGPTYDDDGDEVFEFGFTYFLN